MKFRNFVPRRFRNAIRVLLRELPVRVRDAPSDVRDVFGRRDAIPPPRLRFSVAGTSDRHGFVQVGNQAAREIEQMLGGALGGAVLDFGCGCGRVAAPLARLRSSATFHGVDIDARAIAWCRKHLSGEYRLLQGNRLPFEDRSFDVVYAISVFTHMAEAEQFAWLAEVHRVLKAGGLLLATTHSPELAYARPDLSTDQRASLQATGFAFAPGPLFNDNSAFHSSEYLRSAWSPWFEMLQHQPYGLVGYQDLAVYRRRSSA